MSIGKILNLAGSIALKNVPMGGLVMDLVEITADRVFDRNTTTGAEVQAVIDELPPEVKARLMDKQLDSTVRVAESHDLLRKKMEDDTPSSRARSVIAIAIAVVLLVMACGFGLMLGHAYIYNGVIPSLESLIVVFGLPTVALLTFFGIDTKMFQELILQILTRSVVKGKLK